jgi:hypothetical protein
MYVCKDFIFRTPRRSLNSWVKIAGKNALILRPPEVLKDISCIVYVLFVGQNSKK